MEGGGWVECFLLTQSFSRCVPTCIPFSVFQQWWGGIRLFAVVSLQLMISDEDCTQFAGKCCVIMLPSLACLLFPHPLAPPHPRKLISTSVIDCKQKPTWARPASLLHHSLDGPVLCNFSSRIKRDISHHFGRVLV